MADVVRYYLPSSGAALHASAPDASWSNWWNNTWRYAAVTSKISSALTQKQAGLMVGAGTELICGAIWVTPAQTAHAWTTDDTIKAQLFGRFNNCTSGYLHAVIRVMNADCSSEVGVLWEGDLPTALTGTYPGTNRSLAAGGAHVHVQNAFSMAAGNHIVIEVGANVTGTGIYQACDFYCGDDQDSDYPENETTTTQTDDVWVEFTMETATTIGPSGAIASAEDVDGAAMMRGTIQSEV